jgi:hypothetical protein
MSCEARRAEPRAGGPRSGRRAREGGGPAGSARGAGGQRPPVGSMACRAEVEAPVTFRRVHELLV